MLNELLIIIWRLGCSYKNTVAVLKIVRLYKKAVGTR